MIIGTYKPYVHNVCQSVTGVSAMRRIVIIELESVHRNIYDAHGWLISIVLCVYVSHVYALGHNKLPFPVSVDEVCVIFQTIPSVWGVCDENWN